MPPIDTPAIVGAVVTVSGAFVATLRWIFAVSSKVDETKDAIEAANKERLADRVVYDKRLEKVESAAMDIRDLAAAVRHQGEMTTMQLKALTDKMGEHAEFTRQSLAEVKEGQKAFQAEVRAVISHIPPPRRGQAG